MDKRKKIFHKLEENIPSKDDILNYLSEGDSNLKASSPKKASPSGGASFRAKKESPENNDSFSDNLANIEQDKEIELPAPFVEGASKSKKDSVGDSKANKKRYAFERNMLSNAFVSDAVEGYALLNDKSIAGSFINDINTTISKQTRRKNNDVGLFKVAAIIIMVFMISGISFYLFNQIKQTSVAEVISDENKSVTALSTDTITNSDSIHTMALDVKVENENANGEIKNFELNESISTDGYISQQERSAPKAIVESNNNFGKTNDDLKSLDQLAEKSEVPQSKVQEEDKSISLSDTEDELVLNKPNNKVEIKKDVSSYMLKKEKSKRMINASPSLEYADSITNGRGINKPISKVEEGKMLFNKGRFKEAKIIFDEFEKSNSLDIELIYYSGVSSYNLKLYDESLTKLLKIAPADIHYFDALWYISLSYKSKGNIEKARIIWEELSKSNSFYKAKADKNLLKFQK